MEKTNSVEGDQVATFSIPEAGAMAGIARNASYKAARCGEIPTFKLGGKLRVPAQKWMRILAEGRDASDKVCTA